MVVVAVTGKDIFLRSCDRQSHVGGNITCQKYGYALAIELV